MKTWAFTFALFCLTDFALSSPSKKMRKTIERIENTRPRESRGLYPSRVESSLLRFRSGSYL